ncbi:MAG: FAD-dependent oxidoreductase, partial [Bradyrhizobium sp.]|nr:FAD-dependent oxidoreductase [Bradyrhizobium sp.]
MSTAIQSDVVIVGGGLAGIVTALEAMRRGKSVTLLDRDTPERFGGLALWAFGGMALVGTPLQARMKIPDTPEIALRDWIRFGELDASEHWTLQWARYYVEHSRAEVYDWLLSHGVTFMPAVNWVERGLQGDGNALPRYHIVWGTSQRLTRLMIDAMRAADKGGRLTVLHRHRVVSLDHTAGVVSGVVAVNEETGAEIRIAAPLTVLAMGGINGSHEEARANWVRGRPLPAAMLNGAHPFADGKLHHHAADTVGAEITHAGEMWNYAAGIPHPFPHFEGHGLSLVPCKSALWLNHRGERIGPEPLVTGFDTHDLC